MRILVTGSPRWAEYRVISETARGAINKAMKHVAASAGFVTLSARVTERNVDASAYRRDCVLVDALEAEPA